MGKSGIKIKYLEEWKEAMQENLNGLMNEINQKMVECGLHLMTEAVSITPIDTGDLRGSANVILGEEVIYGADDSGNPIAKSTIMKIKDKKIQQIEVSVGFNKAYAYIVHEDLYPTKGSTNWTDPNTGPKFLEKPFNENIEYYHKIIAEVLNNL